MTYAETEREKRVTIAKYRDELDAWLAAQGDKQPDAFGDGEYERGYNQAIKDVREKVQR